MTIHNRPLRIAILLPDLRLGGAEKLHVVLAAQWLRSGHHVDFVVREKVGDLLHQLPDGVDVLDLSAARVRYALKPLIGFLRTNKPDVLLAAMWPMTVLAIVATRLARFRGRLLVSDHSPLSIAYSGRGWLHRQLLRWSLRIAYPLADVRITVSSGVADDLAALSKLQRECFTVIHNPAALGVKPDGYSVPQLLDGIEGPLILAVGSLKKVKRHDLLIDAFSRVNCKYGATLCIVGDGVERKALIDQVKSAELEKHVFFAGIVDDPSPWYAHSDVFVLSSDYEGFGNVLVEAMEHGLEIVSTDCPFGPREILMGGTFGALVPVRNPAAMAAAIEKALARSLPRSGLRERAAAFSAPKIAEQYLEAMDEPRRLRDSVNSMEFD